jgi:chromate transporter
MQEESDCHGADGTRAGLCFLKTGALVFGSGLAIVPLLRDGVVTQHHWLNQAQFLDAVAMGLLTPGPVVITAAFIGYLVGGPAGALVATVAIFTPIYLGVVLPGRWFAVVTLALLQRFKKIPEPYVVAAAGILGVLLH